MNETKQTSGETSGDVHQIQFATYNVLSSHLSAKAHHISAKPEHLDPENRLQRLLSLLEQEITVSPACIFVLQEVSELWGSKLTIFFERLNYFSFSRFYGNEMSGYMGVLLAVPRAAYQLLDLSSRRISDTVSWPGEDSFPDEFLQDYSDKTLKRIDKAKRRWNCAIWAHVMSLETGKEFCIATYHMPCVFWDEKFMGIHAGLFFKYVQEKSKGLPIVVGGDFNFRPDSKTYLAVVSGNWKVVRSIPELVLNRKDSSKVICTDDLPKKKNKKQLMKHVRDLRKNQMERIEAEDPNINKMTSTYAKFSKEPEFTNIGATKNKFRGTLDYIFITSHFDVLDVISPPEASLEDVFPNETQLSDHIMLKSTLCLV